MNERHCGAYHALSDRGSLQNSVPLAVFTTVRWTYATTADNETCAQPGTDISHCFSPCSDRSGYCSWRRRNMLRMLGR